MFSSKLLYALFPLAVALGVHADRHFTIRNRCPTAIDIYISGDSNGSLAPGAILTKSLAQDFSGFIYTTSNGGNVNGAGTTRAGFYGQNDYYYIVKDPAYFNSGLSITPKKISKNGFCVPDRCDDSSCANAFASPPTRFPMPSQLAPSSPLFSCPGEHVDYSVTFCPSGAFPAPKGAVAIHPNGNNAKCLDVRAASYQNGTPVQIYDCNGTGAQRWLVGRGPTSAVKLAGTSFCLDAGSSPGNGVGMKIWQCYDNLAAQTWQYTGNNKILLKNTDQCLDLTDGVLSNGNQVQTYKCYDNNQNQIWTTTSV